MKHTKNREIFAMYTGKNSQQKIFLRGKWDFWLSDDFKFATIHMFKELKEIISKVFKKNMITMSKFLV